MRVTGKITHWNDDKGYGFITPNSGAKQVFVHISAFNSRIPPPRLNETVTFTPATDQQGRPRAEQVLRAGEAPRVESLRPRQPAARTGDGHLPKSRSAERPRSAARQSSRRSGMGGSALLVVALIAIGAYSYYKLQQPAAVQPAIPISLSKPNQAPAPKFQCDGRTHCSHMSSCEEAFFFIEHCPGTQMDGDGDGIPCESQWCG